MNCWSQTCPSTLSTYTNQPNASCPAYTTQSEPCLQNNQQAAFSGNGWY